MTIRARGLQNTSPHAQRIELTCSEEKAVNSSIPLLLGGTLRAQQMGKVEVCSAIKLKQCLKKDRDSEVGEKIKSSVPMNFSKKWLWSLHILKAQTHPSE